MKSRIALGAFAALSIATFAALHRGAPAAAAPTTKSLEEAVSLGTHWFGPEFSMEDLKGRVVLIEDWGLK